MRFGDLAEAVLSRKRPQLKWRALDPLEFVLVTLCGLLLVGFLVSELGDVVFRILRHPWLEAQEFSIGFFAWGVFMGGAVGVRRNDHFRLAAAAEMFSGAVRTSIEVFQQFVMLGVAGCMAWFGYVNYLNGFGSFLMPSLTPIAVLYAAIPVAGLLIALFSIEKLVNGLRRGFADPIEAPTGLQGAELFLEAAER
ncbi:MAG TPA: TRAP transporter small permease subunit [Acetobacteraceae bacterium]|nr:TRAP transporter small permease subunit [Acetobacteraceae bacterium]